MIDPSSHPPFRPMTPERSALFQAVFPETPRTGPARSDAEIFERAKGTPDV